MVHKIKISYDEFQYPWDVERIVKIASMHGVVLSPREAEQAWDEHSNMFAAGWLNLPEEDENVFWSLPPWARGEKE